jgi:hypothetical protein
LGGAGGPGTLNQTGGTIDTRNVSWGTIIAYDMDSKELTSAWKVDGWTGTDQDGRRMLLTMAYVAASRLLLANSFRDLKPEVLHDLERPSPIRASRAVPGPWMRSPTPVGRASMISPSRRTGIKSRSSTTPCRPASKPSPSRWPATNQTVEWSVNF